MTELMKKDENAQNDDKCKYIGTHGFILLLDLRLLAIGLMAAKL
jgi:hypothetical protein